jgi:uncharacterized repeat protein (TIGR01451 family)
MFAFKSWIGIPTRLALIAIILFSALGPTTASALSAPEPAENTLLSLPKGIKQSTGYLSSSPRSSIVFQVDTPITTPTVIPETLTPEPSMTPTGSIEVTPTLVEETATPFPTLEGTPTPGGTSIPTQTSTASTDAPALSLEFLATPAQAKVGDRVSFALTITNNGTSAIRGLLFSNILPEGFREFQSDDRNFSFDPNTRTLTWKQEIPDPTGQIPPRGRLTLAYSVVADSLVKDVNIVDTANLRADGLREPLLVETSLALLSADGTLSLVDTRGGEAVGLDGKIRISLSERSLDTSTAIFIEDLTARTPTEPQAEPWLQFRLERYLAQPPDFTTPVPNPAGQENDRTTTLQPVETPFQEPVELTVSFDGLLDLATLTGEMIPFLVTLDGASGTWVRVPLEKIDREANLITAKLPHFSVWGIGLGTSVPQNGASILLYDKGYSGLFTGRSDYSLPIWTPPGRNGMGPSLALSYSSGIADGILGDVQAPWVGMGWNIDTVEIARKITTGGCNPCGSGSYGYENRFLLLFNGIAMELYQSPTTPDRYHTKEESFLYIQRHNDSLGNNSPAATNTTGEWWEVVEKDGTRWRLGWTAGAEQLSHMLGYPGTNPPTGAWATLGYAGNEPNLVPFRWRVDQVTDVYGNLMTFTYTEEPRTVGTVTYDRASYMDTISYTGHTSGTPSPGYSVEFELVTRTGEGAPTSPNPWDNWDTKWLDRVDVKYGTNVVRTYDLEYTPLPADSDGGVSWNTTKLTSVAISGGATLAPTTIFTYTNKDNRAVQNGTSNEWKYPRLETVNNGWGSTITYTYGNDGRPYTSWYNWRVTQMDVTDSVNPNPKRVTFAYGTPAYDTEGELVGYPQTTETIWDYSLNAFAKTVHKFFTNSWDPVGREYETLYQNASGTTTRRKILSNWVAVGTSGYPSDVSFYYASSVKEYLLGASLSLIKETQYDYDLYTGNLLHEREYDGSGALYRQTDYEYVTNTASSVWILETLARRTLKDASSVVLSKQEYGYKGNLPGVGSPTRNKPDLSRIVSGTQTIDTKYMYNTTYGNLEQTLLYKNYGTTSSQPSGSVLTYVTDYDITLETYVVSVDPPLLPPTTTGYDFGLGLPTTVTDPNGNTTTTAYDGLGRVLTVKYPGYTSANIDNYYPSPLGNVPYGIRTKTLDEDAGSNAYRTSWKFMDGLGRVIQTQSESENSGKLIFTHTAYNVLGQVMLSDVPQELNGTLGTYSAPNWNSIPHNETTPDELGRVLQVKYPDATTDTFVYYGLRTTTTDRNGHQKIQENDGFGRLIKVEEYTGSSIPYTLYATTNYAYDPRDLLTNVTDAASNPTTIFYDGFGRKVEMTDPDLGNWRYRYNALGHLTAQIDARRRALNMYYDDLNRLKGTSVTGSVNPDTYQPPADPGYSGYSNKHYYDAGPNGYGHRTSMSNSNATISWAYNPLGQAETETHTIDNVTYPNIVTDFDWMNRPLTQTIPRSQVSTETLTYDYTVMQLLSSLKGTGNYAYVSQLHHDATGQVKDQKFGNDLVQQNCYDTNRRKTVLRVYPIPLISQCENTPANLRLNLLYTHQNSGNVSQVLDKIRNETLNFAYDDLDRLTSVNGSYNRTFTYDSIGNLMGKDIGVTHTNPGTTNLAAWWTMDERSGTREDSHVNNYDLTDNNTVGYNDMGVQGRAASFVAASQERLTVQDQPLLSGAISTLP